MLRKGEFKLALVIIGGFLVDSIRIDGEIKVGKKITKGQYIGSFALGGSAILQLSNKDIDVCPSLSSAWGKTPHPVKVEVGANFGAI